MTVLSRLLMLVLLGGMLVVAPTAVPSAGVTSTNWVGIYEPGQTPGDVSSTTYQYTPDASGTVTFSTSSLDGVGSYVAYFGEPGVRVLARRSAAAVVRQHPGELRRARQYRRHRGRP